MSKSPQPMKPPSSQARRMPGLGTIISVAILLLAIGGGIQYFVNTPALQTSDDDQDDELAFLEDQLATGQPQRLASATITDVVTAGHQESEFESQESAIIQAGYAAGSRPPSNPSIWLMGTIEADAESARPALPAWQQDNPLRVR